MDTLWIVLNEPKFLALTGVVFVALGALIDSGPLTGPIVLGAGLFLMGAGIGLAKVMASV